MKKSCRKHGALRWSLALIIVLISTAGLTASAQTSTPKFSIHSQEASGYFQYTIAAGEQVQDVLVASNEDLAPVALEIRTARGITAGNGGIAFAEAAGGLAQWVTLLEPNTVEVPGQSALNLPFRIAVPAGTPPGEYVVGFVAKPLAPGATQPGASIGGAEGESSFRVVVVSQSGVAVIITVPGSTRCEAAIPMLTATSDNGRWQIAIQAQNTGNVHFRSTGEAIARPAAGGEPVARHAFDIGYFIPGDTIDYQLALEPYPAPGAYQIEVALKTDCGFSTTYKQPVSISAKEAQQAAADAAARTQPSDAAAEAAKLLAQAALIRSVALLAVGVGAVLVALIVLVVILRRRKTL